MTLCCQKVTILMFFLEFSINICCSHHRCTMQYYIYFFYILLSKFVNSVIKVFNGSFLDFEGQYIFPITVDF